jgi:hypothetical protein
VVDIANTRSAFAALTSSGSVHCFGLQDKGGDCANVIGLDSGVTSVVGTQYGFAALKDDGTVVYWGGGYAPEDKQALLVGVKSIHSNNEAILALVE